MNARVPIVLSLAVLAAAPAAAQDRRLEERLPAAALPAVQALVEEARAQRLPTEPLVQRALEGAAREAGTERIIAAVREQASRLRTAREVIGSRATEAELTAGAGALYAGVSAAELRRLREARGRGSLAAPLVTLADLIERGVPREVAFSAVLSLVRAGVPDRAYAEFRQEVVQDIGSGAAPGEAASTRAQGALLRSRPAAVRRPPRPRPVDPRAVPPSTPPMQPAPGRPFRSPVPRRHTGRGRRRSGERRRLRAHPAVHSCDFHPGAPSLGPFHGLLTPHLRLPPARAGPGPQRTRKAKRMAESERSRGPCGYCGNEFTRAGMARHLDACEKRKEVIAAADRKPGGTGTQIHLQVRDAYSGDYWLDLEVDGSATLEQLDGYLRAIWLECCGHMSRFSRGGWRGGDIGMARKVGAVFRPGDELTHIYDFGTESVTLLKAVGERAGKRTGRHPIALMARNAPPAFACQECGAPATRLCLECVEEEEPGTLCGEHAEEHPHENYGEPMDLVNSPRVGMCGYDGPAEPPY